MKPLNLLLRPKSPGTALLRLTLMLLGAAVLTMVFQAYLNPGFIIDIANRLILCL